MYRQIGLGLLGCGAVGCELLRLLAEQRDTLRERHGIDLTVRHIVLDQGETSPAMTSSVEVGHDFDAMVKDEMTSIVIDLIEDVQRAYVLARRAINAGRDLVTADKALLAAHAAELLDLAHQSGVQLRFEAAVGAAVPIASALTGALAVTRVRGITAILSGPCNFVLSRMALDRVSFAEAVAMAKQRALFARDLDLELRGVAAAQKLSTIAALAFGLEAHPKDIATFGIADITLEDIAGAATFDYVVRLLGVAKDTPSGVELRVCPAFVPRGTFLAMVQDEFSAFVVDGEDTGEVVLIGRDTGAGPAASAILADVIEIAARGSSPQSAPSFAWRWGERKLAAPEEVSTGFYMRFPVRDEPGVIGKLTSMLGAHDININSAHARELSDHTLGVVEVLTREARVGAVQAAIDELGRSPFIAGPPRVLHIEEWLPEGGYFNAAREGSSPASAASMTLTTSREKSDLMIHRK